MAPAASDTGWVAYGRRGRWCQKYKMGASGGPHPQWLSNSQGQGNCSIKTPSGAPRASKVASNRKLRSDASLWMHLLCQLCWHLEFLCLMFHKCFWYKGLRFMFFAKPAFADAA